MKYIRRISEEVPATDGRLSSINEEKTNENLFRTIQSMLPFVKKERIEKIIVEPSIGPIQGYEVRIYCRDGSGK